MSDPLPAAGGTYLDQEAYIADFERRFWNLGSEGFWKLERMQSYDEGDFPSWQALRRGDWEESLRLIEELRTEYEEYYGKISAAGFALHRVRVVERPIAPYIQWELHLLRTKYEYGERVSVLDATEIVGDETGGPLPELCVLGTEAVYVLDYTPAGAPNGAVRHTDPAMVTRARALIRRLHSAGEPLESYFRREVAELPPPRGV
ncbi:DUF6879 family protein [Streptomyces sp. Ru72]|uniref:DUF6879 family protein n=1 Tax=Streptomyces sp. Ru72 TaxID=2080747 RepID=UPI000CDCF2B9|nr:DUF6879 family protein [Streptomyces sp. Ru72]POX41243.1 hypothetical protein C3488_37880 [Streptomyces sp. Ru72]